jgi:hypothetical protein
VAIPSLPLETTVEIFVRICLECVERRGFSSIRSLCNSLQHRLSSTFDSFQSSAESQSLEAANTARALISLIAKLIIRSERGDAIQLLLPPFLRPAMVDHYSLSSLDKFYFDNIAEIAVCGDMFAYNTIVEFLMNEYRTVAFSPASTRSKFLHNTVPTNLSFIAMKLEKWPQIVDFLSRMLTLFEKIGFHLQRKRMVERVGVIGALGVLLPILSTLLTRIKTKKKTETTHEDPLQNKSLRKLLRNIWFYIFTFAFVDQNRILPEWHFAVQNIACRVPVFLSEGSHNSLEFEVEIQTYLRNGVEDSDAETRKTLLLRLPSLSQAQIRDLTLPQSVYALSVYH